MCFSSLISSEVFSFSVSVIISISALGPDGAVEIVRADVENSVFEGEAVQPVNRSAHYCLCAFADLYSFLCLIISIFVYINKLLRQYSR